MRQLRDKIDHPVSLDYFHERAAAGWKLKAVEWERVENESESVLSEEQLTAPYGVELVPETAHIKANPNEIEVLRTILELIVVEKGVSFIAGELNDRGYSMRNGRPWTSTAVFDLLPRVTETAPDILKSEDWQARRKKTGS